MMPLSRERPHFRCQSCGYVTPKWLGRCPDCGEWNSLTRPWLHPVIRVVPSPVHPVSLSEVSTEGPERLLTGIGELDRALGGGVVVGSVVLLGGPPGIGKSTLLLQASLALAETAGPVLYVTGEESVAQVKLRAERLGVLATALYLLAETSLEAIEAQVAALAPRVLVVDSIQTVYLSALESSPGSVGQMQACGARLVRLAKGRGLSTFLVGHVTKGGTLAGPRVLEYLVDTVLYIEGKRDTRMLRAVKNRFGATTARGRLTMTPRGLRGVS